MALPKINENKHYIKITLPNGKKIGIRGWVVRDEKELMFAIESDENKKENKLDHIINFLRNCVDDQALFDTLGEESLRKIVIETRKLAKGDRVEYSYSCPYCKMKLKDEVHLSKDERVKSFDSSPVVVNDKLTVTFKELSYSDLIALENKYGDSTLKYDYYYLLNSIEGISYNNQVYTTFTEEEIDEFIGQLQIDELAKLDEAFEKNKSSVSIERKLKCENPKCGEEVIPNFGDLFHFLAL